MTPVWAQRREALLHDCIVSPDVFNPMVDRLATFVMPYQQALQTEATQRNMHLYLQELLSHLPSKNVEDITTLGIFARPSETVHEADAGGTSLNANGRAQA